MCKYTFFKWLGRFHAWTRLSRWHFSALKLKSVDLNAFIAFLIDMGDLIEAASVQQDVSSFYLSLPTPEFWEKQSKQDKFLPYFSHVQYSRLQHWPFFCYSEAPENQTCLIIVSWIEGKLWKWQSCIDSLHRQKSIHSAWLWILLKSSVSSSSTLMMSDEATRVQINDAASLQVFTHSV